MTGLSVGPVSALTLWKATSGQLSPVSPEDFLLVGDVARSSCFSHVGLQSINAPSGLNVSLESYSVFPLSALVRLGLLFPFNVLVCLSEAYGVAGPQDGWRFWASSKPDPFPALHTPGWHLASRPL